MLNRRTLIRLANLAVRLPIPLRLWYYLERLSAYAQGKGWGSTPEHEVWCCLNLLGRTPHVVIDIGANRGAYTHALLTRVPSARIWLFEPAATNQRRLQERFHGHSSITILPQALSDRAGRSTLFADRAGSALGSLARRDLEHCGIEILHEEPVLTERFDAFWNAGPGREYEWIDYVKMDVEGHELSVLEGFGKLIHRVRLIQFEFGGCNVDSRTFFRDFWRFFTHHSFSLHRITPQGTSRIDSWSESMEFFSTTNFIAVKHDE